VLTFDVWFQLNENLSISSIIIILLGYRRYLWKTDRSIRRRRRRRWRRRRK